MIADAVLASLHRDRDKASARLAAEAMSDELNEQMLSAAWERWTGRMNDYLDRGAEVNAECCACVLTAMMCSFPWNLASATVRAKKA